MKAPVLVVPVIFGLMACNPFNRAEKQLDNPDGSIADAQLAVKGSFSQNVAADIVAATSGSVAIIPLSLEQGALENPGLSHLLTHPDLSRHELKLARNVLGLLVKEGALQDATPYVAGNIDVGLETAGQCSGDISFNVDTDVKIFALLARVDARMDFNNVVCPEGSIDGFVGLRIEVDANPETASFKLLEVVEATVSDNVETAEVEFALRADAALESGEAVVDMSVIVNDRSLTVNIVNDLATGVTTVKVRGTDGEVTCEITSDGTVFSATCDNGEVFEI